MKPTSLVPDGEPHTCPVCGTIAVCVVTRQGDTFCPACGSQFWVRLPLSRDGDALVRGIRERGGRIEVDGLTSQWNVDLSGTGVGDDFVAGLLRLGNVGELLLNDLPITDGVVDALCGLDELEVLELDGTRISDSGVRSLTGAFKRLEVLSLADTPIGNAGLEGVDRLRRLWCLDLDRTAITDGGLRGLGSCRRLEWLFLNGTRVTDAGLEILTEATPLQRLEIRETRVTHSGVDRLRNRLSGCDLRVR